MPEQMYSDTHVGGWGPPSAGLAEQLRRCGLSVDPELGEVLVAHDVTFACKRVYFRPRGSALATGYLCQLVLPGPGKPRRGKAEEG